jgi:curved DNA-binding protein CbpA
MPPFVRAQLDYYGVLEITPSADVAEVNAAFRRLAWRYHPDRNPAPGATLQFQDINEAHQVLSDPERRTEYDAKWHPELKFRRKPARSPVRPHSYRSSRRHRRVHAVLLTLFAFVFVSSAWAAIFTAITAAHHSGSLQSLDAPRSFGAETSASCGFSMEIFPVSYTDEHGHQTTGWETDVRNCWGGSTRVSSIPSLQAQKAFGTRGQTSYH